jgi:hypothetical protein
MLAAIAAVQLLHAAHGAFTMTDVMHMQNGK